MGKEKEPKPGFMTTGKERFSYGLYFLGQNIFYVFVYLYLAVFFTDVGIPAMTVAGIALAVKVWDAVNAYRDSGCHNIDLRHSDDADAHREDRLGSCRIRAVGYGVHHLRRADLRTDYGNDRQSG